nr:hypothetical protein [Enterobacter bugandensis]
MKTLPDQLPDSFDELRQMMLEREAFWAEQVAQWQDKTVHWQGQYQALLQQWRLAQHKQLCCQQRSLAGTG